MDCAILSHPKQRKTRDGIIVQLSTCFSVAFGNSPTGMYEKCRDFLFCFFQIFYVSIFTVTHCPQNNLFLCVQHISFATKHNRFSNSSTHREAHKIPYYTFTCHAIYSILPLCFGFFCLFVVFSAVFVVVGVVFQFSRKTFSILFMDLVRVFRASSTDYGATHFAKRAHCTA